ncbi:Protein of unknown function, partial [Cotesia congregata]
MAKRGRLSGGQLVGIKKSLGAEWRVAEWEYGFIIKFRAEKCIISVYNNINMSILEPKLKELLEISMCEFDSIIICGDMNARVGSAQMCNGMDECECRVQSRRTQDESINENGKKLIKIGEEMGLMLLNGRCKGDEEGKITYVGCDKQSKGSVLDLVMIVDRGDEDIVKRLCVVTRTESDHLPVTFELGAIMEKEQSIEFLRSGLCILALFLTRMSKKRKKSEVMKRAISYVKDILNMEEDRWPRICLTEEMRAVLNGNPSKWGAQMAGILQNWKAEEVCEWIWKGGRDEEVHIKLMESLNNWWEKELEAEWSKIVESKYNSLYKEILPGANGAAYLSMKVKRKMDKETWARIRCGNVGRAGKKGYKDWSCRLCGGGEETLAHICTCSEAWRLQTDETKSFMEIWKGNRIESEMRSLLVKTLRGEIIEELCTFIRVIENKLKD